METKLEHISEARAHVISHAPARPTLAQLREEERALEQSIKGLDRHVQDLQHYRRREQRLEQRREPRTWKDELAAERVLAAAPSMACHGIGRRSRWWRSWSGRSASTAPRSGSRTWRRPWGRTTTHGAGLRVRLFEREEEEQERGRQQDRGLGW